MLLQRVTEARVTVGGRCSGRIGRGLLVFVGLDGGDHEALAEWMLDRMLGYRVFPDGDGRMNRSLTDVRGGVLLVSQFTLAADTRTGTRPGFSRAMPPAPAARLYDWMLARLRERHPDVAAGEFGADMRVSLVNDGPVTFLLDSGAS